MALPKQIAVTSEGFLGLLRDVQETRGWPRGADAAVVDLPEGVLIKAPAERVDTAGIFRPDLPRTRLEDVVGMLKYDGPPISIADIKRGIVEEAGRRWELFERTGSDYEDNDLD